MDAIASKTLTPDVWSEICRALVTHMYGFVEKPTSQFCKYFAQRLILKYPFMRDGKGTGYVSLRVSFYYGQCIYMYIFLLLPLQGTWERKLYDRVHNMKRKRTVQDERECGL